MMITGRIKIAPGMMYIVAQGLGAVVATAALYLALEDGIGEISNFGAQQVQTVVVDGEAGGLVVEIILAMVLVMAVLAVVKAQGALGALGPLLIGLTVIAVYLVGWNLTGASINPARTFGPTVVSDAFNSFWVFLLGPAIGAMLAVVLIDYGLVPREES